MMRATLFHIFVFLALAAFAEKQPLDRYMSIIDRQMFGPLPKGFDPAKMPSEVAKTSQKEMKELTKEQEELKKAVHFSVLNVRQTGEVEVGFSDLSQKDAPKHYFLKVGDSQDGWKVESADVESATATLEKDGVVLELSLGDNSAKGGGSAKKSEATASTSGTGLRRPANALFGTARERRLRQQEERRAQEEQRLKAEREEREAEREKFKQEFQAALDNVKRDLEARAEQKKAEEAQQAKTDEENDTQ